LPNSFTAKTATPSLRRGLGYLVYFVHEYAWAPVVLLFLLRPKRIREQQRHIGVAIAILVGWLLYVAGVGGCFMEFRLLVPVLPLATVLLAAGSPRFRHGDEAAIVSCLAAASVTHAMTFRHWRGVESIIAGGAPRRAPLDRHRHHA
jgi:hypothetical protein